MFGNLVWSKLVMRSTTVSDGVPDPFFALFLSLVWFGEWIDIYPTVPVGAPEVGIAL